jgi:CubicO group peptidase (beta-lactamase class C family)
MRTQVIAPPHRSPRVIALALALAALVALLGMLARPNPPTLSTRVSGDPALAAAARPLLRGALDRASIAVIDGDTVAYAHFGASDDTTYEIGSITKTFTGLLLADAIARGEVTADTKVGAFLPLAGAPVADVTLAELASHRSGLPSVPPGAAVPLSMLRWLTHRDPFIQDVDGVVTLARAATLTGRGQVAYSNLGAALLGQALAAASHRDYARLVRERAFIPLGMGATTVPVTADHLPADAPTGYSAAGHTEAAWTMHGAAPAGGIRSTPADLVRYARALLDCTAPGLEALAPRWDAPDGRRVGYAWFTEERSGRTLTWHNGQTGGFASALILDRANGRAVIILSNTATDVTRAAFTLMLGEY